MKSYHTHGHTSTRGILLRSLYSYNLTISSSIVGFLSRDAQPFPLTISDAELVDNVDDRPRLPSLSFLPSRSSSKPISLSHSLHSKHSVSHAILLIGLQTNKKNKNTVVIKKYWSTKKIIAKHILQIGVHFSEKLCILLKRSCCPFFGTIFFLYFIYKIGDP